MFSIISNIRFLRYLALSIILPICVTTNATEERVIASLSKHLPSFVVTAVDASVIEGFYEVEVNDSGLIYVSSDGTRMIRGEIYDLSGDELYNITRRKIKEKSMSAFSELIKSETIKYKSKGGTRSIYVLTDVDCYFCRKFHKEVPKLLSLGIEVNYIMFPQKGLDSMTGLKFKYIWCSGNREKAMSDIVNGSANFSEASVCDVPLTEHMIAGRKMRNGNATPQIYTDKGELIGGYVTAVEVAKSMGITGGY